MKKLALFILLLISVYAFAQTDKGIPARPNPPRLVNDLADVMSPDQVNDLERKLIAYDDSTSNQIAVVTVKTIGDNAIEDVALGILRQWGVGNKQKNNGIVILAAIQDHKIYIATGYGLEGAVPDITAKSIIDNDIVPNFRQENYYRGFDQATSSLIKAAAGEYTAPEGYADRGRSRDSGPGGFGIIIAVIILIIILRMFRGGGGGGGGFMSRRGYRGFGGPFFFPTNFGGGGGGGWSGGGGGGGGFGGFGGGSGGGGGAGGSW